MVRRGFVCRGHLDHIRVVPRTTPNHQADRERMWQLGLHISSGGDVLLLVLAEDMFWVDCHGYEAGGNVGLRRAEQGREPLAATLRSTVVHLRLKRAAE